MCILYIVYIHWLYAQVFSVLQAGVCMGQANHGPVQLHGAGGVVLQLSGSAERRPAGGHQTHPGRLPKVNCDLCKISFTQYIHARKMMCIHSLMFLCVKYIT